MNVSCEQKHDNKTCPGVWDIWDFYKQEYSDQIEIAHLMNVVITHL